jgi:hypothetical protein
MSDVHTCSYYCDRQACIKAQRDDLRDRQAALQSGEPVAWLCVNEDGDRDATASADAKNNYARFGRKIFPLYTTPQPVVPEGYVLVPLEPTEAMEAAGMVALCGSIGGYESAAVLKAWSAMLSAGNGGE